MTPEAEIAEAILARLDALIVACDDDYAMLGSAPASLAEFDAMDRPRRVASRALLKTVEQLQDQLARFFRLLPRLALVDASGWHAQDFANHAEKAGVLADAFAWSDIVRLRNRLVHDYPLTQQAQFDALRAADAAVPVLRQTAAAARAHAQRWSAR